MANDLFLIDVQLPSQDYLFCSLVWSLLYSTASMFALDVYIGGDLGRQLRVK